MIPVVTAAAMRAVDAKTIEVIGIPGAVLMETAGRAVVAVVLARLEHLGKHPAMYRDKQLGVAVEGQSQGQRTQEVQSQGRQTQGRVCVICGGGNNGGDGFVIARVLQEHGVDSELFLCVQRSAIQGDAALHAAAFENCGGTIISLQNDSEARYAEKRFDLADVLVDALLGTGLDRELTGVFAQTVDAMNASRASVVAVDIASGLRADDGQTMGVSVQATETVALGCAKIANISAPGFVSTGTLHVAEIGIPRRMCNDAAAIGVVEKSDVVEAFEGDDLNTHKGRRGHVLVVAGSAGKRGAGRLAGLAALRSGAGLVTVAGPTLDEAAPDPLMTAVLDSAATLRHAMQGKSALLIGPGMPTDALGAEWIAFVVAQCRIPIVMDADALNHLVGALQTLRKSESSIVLTPHPGEAARLLGVDTAVIQADRIAAVRELAAVSGALVVLKGARTCICDGRESAVSSYGGKSAASSAGRESAASSYGGESAASSYGRKLAIPRFVAINPTGGPQLSTAGTGDVLAGMIVALLGRGLSAQLATQAAVYWHGEAGRIAVDELGGFGMIASDLIMALPRSSKVLSV